ncbi:MAG: hypothetical protein MI700_10380, partial [Balneolales bacterium]|nr:hypothetical protein [Balneolales bacterium]
MNEDVLWDPLVPEVGESVLINTADWSEVLEITEAAEGYLEEFDPLMYEKDLEFIQHTIELYTYLAQGRLNIVESSKLYKEAVHIQSAEPVEARKLLVSAFEGINETYEELFELKVENQYLWVNENRVYALDRIISKYEAQLQSLSELRETVLQTIYDFDKGKVLPEAASVRLEITETEGWYFQGWLMIEPIPNPGGFEDPGVDHLEDMSGIAGTFPNVTEEFYHDGVKYRWRRVNTPYFAKVDLDELHGQNENVVMYAFAHIDIFEDRTVRAMLGSSDGVEVYVNGESVHKNYAKREFELDEDELFLPLKAGRNHLMVRITNTSGDWAFSFRLPDSEMRSTKNRYRIIE